MPALSEKPNSYHWFQVTVTQFKKLRELETEYNYTYPLQKLYEFFFKKKKLILHEGLYEVARLFRSWRLEIQGNYFKLGKLNCREPTECKSNDGVGFVYREIPQWLSSGQDMWYNLYLFMSSDVT